MELCARCGRQGDGHTELLEWVGVTLPDGEVGFACPRCLTDRELRAEHDYILDVPSKLPRQASRCDARP